MSDQSDERTSAPGRATVARRRRARAAAITIVGAAVLWAALALPTHLPRLAHYWWVAQVPLAAIVFTALVLIAPRRTVRVVALVAGGALGVLVIVKALNIGFHSVFDRGFDVVGDWYYLGPGFGVLSDTVGRAGALMLAVGVVLLVVAVLVATPLAAARAARALRAHRRRVVPVLAAVAVLWVGAAVTGLATGPGMPVASAGTSHVAWRTLRTVPTDLADRATFARDIDTDPYRGTDPLLAGLHGHDVLVVFLESIGAAALKDPDLAGIVGAAMTDGEDQLNRAGFAARSAWLVSPTFGGASWLAHSTVQSGLWVDSQQRYDQLLATDRLTLTDAFGAGGWRTVFDVPAMTQRWPEGKPFYHFDMLYTADNVGYHGPRYGYATMPDQFTLSALQTSELDRPGRPPLMAEIDLLSSHYPWTEPPAIVPWDDVGDGSGFAPPVTTTRPRKTYADAVAYVIKTLASFAAHSHDPKLVVIAMGDHQPKMSITGPRASHRVPAMVIAHDRAILDRIGAWGWTSGLRPGRDSPVWRMSALRNKLFATFGEGTS